MELEYLVEEAKREVILRRDENYDNVSSLSEIIDNIVEIAPCEENLDLENLFKDITALDKFTGEFYGLFMKKTFPFSKRVMRHAINVEPYYNNNDMALEAYLLFAAEEMGQNKKEIIAPFIKSLGKGHFGNYYFKKISEINNYEKIAPNGEIKNVLVDVFKKSQFHETRNKALLSGIYFNVVELEKPLKNMIKKRISSYELMEPKVQNKGVYDIEQPLRNLTADISYFFNALSYLKLGDFESEANAIHNVFKEFDGLDNYKLDKIKNTEPYKKIYSESYQLIQNSKQKLSH